jgi:ABC-2 type transport system ATP-binding protein
MIRTEGLSKRYGDFVALHPLDLHVRKGEVFGFVGPNGAGKTTTIRVLTGVLPPSQGTVTIDGVDLLNQPVEARRRIGYIPDRPYLYEKLTGWEFLEFIAGLYDLDDERLRVQGERLLKIHGLWEVSDHLIEGYSHGMKQRLILSATMLHRPRLLVVDEPMVGLDPRGARLIKQVFREVAAEGRTVFLSTHSLDVAQEVCDRIAILHKGRIVALGTLAELRKAAKAGDASLEGIFLKITQEDAMKEDIESGAQP